MDGSGGRRSGAPRPATDATVTDPHGTGTGTISYVLPDDSWPTAQSLSVHGSVSPRSSSQRSAAGNNVRRGSLSSLSSWSSRQSSAAMHVRHHADLDSVVTDGFGTTESWTSGHDTTDWSDDGRGGGGGRRQRVGAVRSISFLGGVCLLLNSTVGPGLVAFPALFQRAGWVPALTALLVVAATSTLAGLMLLKAMVMMYEVPVVSLRGQYAAVVSHYLPRCWAIVAHGLMQLTFALVLTSAVVQAANAMDWLIIQTGGESYGLAFTPHFDLVSTNGDDVSSADAPFAEVHGPVFTVGMVCIAVLCAPVATLTLGRSLPLQKASVMCLAAVVGAWVWIFVGAEGVVPDRVTPVGPQPTSKALGTVLLNFSVVMLLPAWVSEKHRNVDAARSLTVAMGATVVTYAVVGWLGGLAFASYYDSKEDLLDKLDELANGSRAHSVGARLGLVTEYLFPLAVNATSIPVYCVMMRYNAIQAGLLSPRAATVVSTSLPWMLGVALYSGTGLGYVVDWAGAALVGASNLVVPLVCYIVAVRRAHAESEKLRNRGTYGGGVHGATTSDSDRDHDGTAHDYGRPKMGSPRHGSPGHHGRTPGSQAVAVGFGPGLSQGHHRGSYDNVRDATSAQRSAGAPKGAPSGRRGSRYSGLLSLRHTEGGSTNNYGSIAGYGTVGALGDDIIVLPQVLRPHAVEVASVLLLLTVAIVGLVLADDIARHTRAHAP